MKQLISTILVFTFLTATQLQALALNIPADTKVRISLKEQYTSEMINKDKVIPAEICEDVTLNNNIIFKKGDNVKIMVEEYKKKRFFGRGGYIIIKDVIINDTKNNEHIFSLNQKFEGENRDWVLVCVGCGVFIILAPLALLGFVKGQSATISENTIFNTYLKNSFTY